MIDKEFVPYELALELKQLGFDEPCFKYIYTGDTGNNVNIPCEVVPSSAKNYNEDDLCVSTPTYSQTFRWFRTKFNCHHTINLNKKYVGIAYSSVVNFSVDEFNTYEEAELACLKALIEIHKAGNKS
jgi:hypothetical protein